MTKKNQNDQFIAKNGCFIVIYHIYVINFTSSVIAAGYYKGIQFVARLLIKKGGLLQLS